MDDSNRVDGPARQRAYYREGLAAESPVPVDPAALREAAVEAMDPAVRAFVTGSAGEGETERANREALDSWQIVPRALRDVSQRDLATTLFGRTHPAPVLFAPVGVQSVVHEDAEPATAEAAAALGLGMALSTAASTPMEDVAAALGDAPGWFQLYWSADRELTRSFVDRAEAAGYEAIVLTVDMPVRGWIVDELAEGAFPLSNGHGFGNYLSDPVFREALDAPPEDDLDEAIDRYLDVGMDASVTREQLRTLREWTDLPVVLKGVLRPEDARRAVDAGADGVVVSTHGGRAVDGSVGALDALPDIADAVDVPVLFDSGIRTGTDVFKSLALGADAVMIGRPYLYGLALAGADGAQAAMENLLAELDVTLGTAGYADVADLDRSALRRHSGAGP